MSLSSRHDNTVLADPSATGAVQSAPVAPAREEQQPIGVGAFLLAAQFPGQGHAEALDRAMSAAVTAEQAGLTDVWLAEHHFVPYGVCPSATTLAALLLGRTRRIGIGTAVSVLPTQHPVALGEQAALLHLTSGGRFTLGVGRGGPWVDLNVFGTGLEAFESGFPESLDLLLRWLRDPRVGADGPRYSFPEVEVVPRATEQPLPQDGPPGPACPIGGFAGSEHAPPGAASAYAPYEPLLGAPGRRDGSGRRAGWGARGLRGGTGRIPVPRRSGTGSAPTGAGRGVPFAELAELVGIGGLAEPIPGAGELTASQAGGTVAAAHSGPPVIVACTSKSSVQLAAERGLPILLGMHSGDDDKVEMLAAYRAAARAAGRTPGQIAEAEQNHVAAGVAQVGDSVAEARRTLLRSMPDWFEHGLTAHRTVDGRERRMRDPRGYTELLCDLHAVGSARYCADRLAATAERTGIRRFALLVEGTGDRAETLRNVSRLGGEVLPQLR
jgi:alkanesulfonate monooxygenase SsuD/methylene tetrahydromethanopterin reductase-like flavin-dependent oxidoreductase (luciferase family)